MWRAITILCVVIIGVAYWLNQSTTFQLFGELVARVETDARVVALTFDDGPTVRHTPAVIEMLADLDVQATFYLNGGSGEGAPEAVAALVAAGHALGNHSWSHRRMVLMSPATVRREIEETSEVLRAGGYEGLITFRPPYGDKLVVLPWVLSQMGMVTVMWDVSPEADVGPDDGAEQIAARAIADAGPGSIIGLHVMFDQGAETRRAVPMIVEGLRAEGYRFVTVPELLEMR